MYIVKLDAGGTLQWNKTVGGTGLDVAYSIVQTIDGGYAVAGYTRSFGAGNADFNIVKLNSSGSLQWTRTVGGTNDDYAYSIVQTTDRGYAVVGYTNSFGAGLYDMYIVKLDSSGALQWSRTVGGTNQDYAYSIIQTTDGGYAVAGETYSFGIGNNGFYIVKLNISGSLQWNRTLDIGGRYAHSIIQTTDGGYAVAGSTLFGAGGYDMYIVKLNGSGTLQWGRTIGGTYIDYALSIIQTTDGGYAVAGYTLSFGAGNSDFYMVKLDAAGPLQWSRTVGGPGDDLAYSIIQTTDGGYAVGGATDSFGAGGDMYVVKLDSSGNTCGNSTSPPSISGSGGTTTSPTSTVTTPTPTVTSPTPTTGTGGTVTSICFVGIQPISNEIPGSYELEQNYPNPFNAKTVLGFQLPVFSHVRLIIYDILGREIETLIDEDLKPGAYEVKWNASDYPSGIYIYKLTAGDFSDSRKMVLIK